MRLTQKISVGGVFYVIKCSSAIDEFFNCTGLYYLRFDKNKLADRFSNKDCEIF
jgi:hypothetical protein